MRRATVLLAVALALGLAAAQPDELVVVHLPNRNAADLKALLERQSDPSSPDYRKFLTPDEFAARFGASDADVAAATAGLQAAGFTVTPLGRGALLATGHPNAVETAFNTTLVAAEAPAAPQAQPPAQGGAASPLDAAPPVASSPTGLEAVTPLQPTPELNLPPGTTVVGPPVVGAPRFRAGAATRPLPSPQDAPNGFVADAYYQNYAYWTNDLRQAYSVPALSTGINGSGRTVCNLMAGDFLDSDLAAYMGVQNLQPPSSITRIPILGGCTRVNCPIESSEMILDVSIISGAAPGVALRIYALPNLLTAPLLAGLTAIVNDNVCDIVNMSFAGGEQSASYAPWSAPFEALYEAGNAQGITFVAASGDYASNGGCVNADGATPYLYNCVNFPASLPSVTGVGGTSLIAGSTAGNGLNGTSNSPYISENAWPGFLTPWQWNAYNGQPVAGGAWGSGGGVSMWFPKPAYQNLVNTGGYTMRTVPDVAGMMGNLGATAQCPQASCSSAYFYINGGTLSLVYGTSGSSPFFVGLLALWQQHAGGVRFGNVNPTLYAKYAAERDPKAAVAAKLGVPPFNLTAAIASKPSAAAAVKPDLASKIEAATSELTALANKQAAKAGCVTRQSGAGPLAQKVKLCAFNDDIPGSNIGYASGTGGGGYSLVLGLGTVNAAPLLGVTKMPLSGPWTINSAVIATLDTQALSG